MDVGVRVRAQFLILVIVAVVFAGCAAQSTPAPKPAASNVVAPPGAPQEWMPGLSAIEVVVVSDEAVPLADALVAIYEPFLLEAFTDAAGYARFQNLEPGTYKVGAQAPAHSGAVHKVELAADTTERVTLILRPVAIQEPYYVPFIDDGIHVLCIAPFPFGIAGTCNAASAGPISGEKSRFTHPAQAGLFGYVGELVWQTNSFLGARFMDLSANDAASATPSKTFYGYRTGMSPIRLLIDVEPIETPFNVTDRVDVNYDCDTSRVGNCTANLPSSMYAIDFQQRFRLYSAHFYGAAAPAEFSMLPDA